uniref:Uncharacterized protein n=1 Tax=Aegilops tauschii subsp. strangulata TaxID=200361 RepID=A0A453PR08_AEGTS
GGIGVDGQRRFLSSPCSSSSSGVSISASVVNELLLMRADLSRLSSGVMAFRRPSYMLSA